MVGRWAVQELLVPLAAFLVAGGIAGILAGAVPESVGDEWDFVVLVVVTVVLTFLLLRVARRRLR